MSRQQPLGPRPGVSGTLVSGVFAERRLPELFAGQLGESTRQRGCHAIGSWVRRYGGRLGPASGLTSLAAQGAAPLVDAIGYSLALEDDATSRGHGPAGSRGPAGIMRTVAHASEVALPIAIFPWGESMDRRWTDIVALAVDAGTEWVACFNGRTVRLCDAKRSYARDFVEFDLERVATDPVSFALFWAIMRPEALRALTRQVADASARHGVSVCASLKTGVRDALGMLLQAMVTAAHSSGRASVREVDPENLFAQALTVIYRILFLLFAESRCLVPVWHPVYRTSYTIESLRSRAEHPGRHRGLWEAFQALSRLAHSGCRAGSLRVTPFNGRLFAPDRTPFADQRRLDDKLVAKALVALTTSAGANGRERISFRDLGVEQLGAVYESVLDYQPVLSGAVSPRVRDRRVEPQTQVTLVEQRDRRKASGTFYTPQSLTDYLVRQTLHPLVADATPEQILALRVLDPAMGSGAFLVAACRYLAAAYEQAVLRHRGWLAADITNLDRAGFRRLVARHCLYGVDVNPMAVQVARLSLWLATLAADRPLTFLDHRLAVGDSLVGASLDDLARQPPGAARSVGQGSALPLFDTESIGAALERVLPMRMRLEQVDDDTAEAVRDKERWLASLWATPGPLAPLKRAADLWCACWFWDERESRTPDGREYADLAAALRSGISSLPPQIVESRLAEAARIADARRFFHWTLEFPEVFFDASGRPSPSGGFDAVVGNPPWEMLRADNGEAADRQSLRNRAAQVTRFTRHAGIYRLCNRGHTNQYQLFVERSLRLVRRGGRVGLVVPWGLASDHGCADLRRVLLEECDTDRLIGLDNAAGIFPIHRGVRFLLLSTTTGSRTRRIHCRFGTRNAADLDAIDAPSSKAQRRATVALTPAYLQRVSGQGLAIPHLLSRRDRVLTERLVLQFPALSAPGGWHATFGRELNVTDDKALFVAAPASTAIPVVEGKHIDPFVVHLAACDRWVVSTDALANRSAGRATGRFRLAYRDVAASSNRLTLIAGLLPPQTIAVHTVHCLKTPLAFQDQAFLLGVLNSFVANYLARLWVTTHLGTTTVERLPVPKPDPRSRSYRRVSALALALRCDRPGWTDRYAELQAEVARAYELSDDELGLMLDSFPLVDADLRADVAARAARRRGPKRSTLGSSIVPSYPPDAGGS
jgi:hypothetical protein